MDALAQQATAKKKDSVVSDEEKKQQEMVNQLIAGLVLSLLPLVRLGVVLTWTT